MFNDLGSVKNELDNIESKISSFNTDERKEIKKNNKLIESYLLELEQIGQLLLNEIKCRYEELIPLKNDDLELVNLIDVQYEKILFLSNNSYISKMNIDKNIYEIKCGNSLDKINENLCDLVDKFKKINIELNKEDFKYSLSLYKYMGDFFDNKDEEEFNVKIKDAFDSLYWECPDMINHLYLNLILLLEKYKDKFENYIKNKCTDNLGYDLELENYYKLVIQNNDKVMSDKYLVYEKFSDGMLRIEEYLNTSINKKDIISKFIDYDKYVNLNDEERKYFYEKIKGIYYDLCESLLMNKYGYLIDKIKEVYSNKNNYVNNYSSFIKDTKMLDKQREKLNNKLFMIYNRMNDKNRDRLLKKYNNLFNKVNSKISEIINSYNNYDEILLIDDIIKKVNDDSTYYDVFKIFENNYSYLINFMKDKDGSYEEYMSFLYNPYLSISKSIPFINNIDIENKLSEKYDLFDIDINLSDKDKLKVDLEYIIRLSYFESGNIDVDKFKLIFDIKKIIGE